MCPAIHISSRSWLRSSSTHEPSDPPLRIVLSIVSFDAGVTDEARRLPPRPDPNPTRVSGKRQMKTGGERERAGRLPFATERSAADLPSYRSFVRTSDGRCPKSGGTLPGGKPKNLRCTQALTAVAPCLGPGWASAETSSRSHANDPSAGSPTETLLRLLLPLNDQV